MRLLLVEDEMSLAVGLLDVLRVKGYDVDHAVRGDEGLVLALRGAYDLIVLDGMLPGLSGFDLLRQLRAAGHATPVIMLSARNTEADRVLGFELGVDDYVTKPFSLLELLGRIAAVLRRTKAAAPATSPTSLRFGDVVVDLDRFTVSGPAGEAAMPTRGFHVLRVLSSRRGQVVPRDTLIDEAWGVDEAIAPRTLHNVIVRIRQVIEADVERPQYLKTVHGVGYRLDL